MVTRIPDDDHPVVEIPCDLPPHAGKAVRVTILDWDRVHIHTDRGRTYLWDGEIVTLVR
jgi:hypothetical protein